MENVLLGPTADLEVGGTGELHWIIVLLFCAVYRILPTCFSGLSFEQGSEILPLQVREVGR